MIIVLVNDRDGHRRPCEPERGVEAAETSADDDNARKVRLRQTLFVYVILIGWLFSNRFVVLAELSHLFSPYRRYTKVLPFSVTLREMRVLHDATVQVINFVWEASWEERKS